MFCISRVWQCRKLLVYNHVAARTGLITPFERLETVASLPPSISTENITEFYMPLIELWLGIKFTMYFGDHNPPHFHAEYQGEKALFRIDDGSRIDGSLPPKAEKRVREWYLDNKQLIEQKWSEYND